MANTYTQIHVHLVFAVQNRLSLIDESWADNLYKYITSIIQNNNHKVLAIGGMPDHLHLLIGLRPDESLSHLVQEIKRDSSLWINEKRYVNGKFSWQEGYGAFSYSKSQLLNVTNYILNQKEHHQKKTFIEEYVKVLSDFGLNFDEKYIFKPV
jgi:REP element-mobilizing transposase RayT